MCVFGLVGVILALSGLVVVSRDSSAAPWDANVRLSQAYNSAQARVRLILITLHSSTIRHRFFWVVGDAMHGETHSCIASGGRG